jgi:hypothetical protein
LDFDTDSFRWGAEHLSPTDSSWIELTGVLASISRIDVIQQKRASLLRWKNGQIKSPRVGGQDLLNTIIQEKLLALGWEDQVFVLDITAADMAKIGKDLDISESDIDGDAKVDSKQKKASTRKLSYWTMDFKKGYLGVEVSFNNAGVLAQNLLRLSVMSESYLKPKEKKIRLGILITATESLKKWSNMDTTVLTYESVQRVFPLINFNIPTPIVLIGLNNSTDGEIWAETEIFGHQKLAPYNEMSHLDKAIWDKLIEMPSSDL